MLAFLFGMITSGSPAIALEPGIDILAEQSDVQSLQVEMKVIHATTQHNNVDPNVKSFLKYFENYKYTGYKLLDNQSRKFFDMKGETFYLPADIKVDIKILSHNKKNAKVSVKIINSKTDHKYINSVMTVPRNGNFMVAGPKYDGGILILPLSVRY